MHPADHNVFAALARYADRAGENYLTEAFAVVLREVARIDPVAGARLASRILGLPDGAVRPDLPVTIGTQEIGEEGRPDLVIRQAGRLVGFVEVKDDADLHAGQLEGYRRDLDRQPEPLRALALLSRSKAVPTTTTLPSGLYERVSWYEVHEWLDELGGPDTPLGYLAQGLCAFLKQKGMAMDRVSWEYMRGVPAMMALTQLLEGALPEALPGIPWKRTAGWTWRGLMLGREYGYFTGIRYDAPLVLVFEDNKGWKPVYTRALDLERSHFFALPQGEQLEVLVSFLRDCATEGQHPELHAATDASSMVGVGDTPASDLSGEETSVDGGGEPHVAS